jgi:YfiH family protein
MAESTIHMANTVETLRSAAFDSIAHGFLGRAGGVSAGIFAGLNIALGSADDRASVLENRARAVTAVMPGAMLARVYQVHSADVVNATDAISRASLHVEDNPPRADALVCDRPGILLGVSTADCAPVLFADSKNGIIGAAHSGWKGAIGGVNEATIAAMENLGADRDNIVCAIGPCIAQKSYEVDTAFFRRFAEADPANERFFGDGKPDHFQFDLEGYVAAQLAASGIKKIECLGQDTYSQPDRFFSYRRSCHRGEPSYGAQFSVIGLPV